MVGLLARRKATSEDISSVAGCSFSSQSQIDCDRE